MKVLAVGEVMMRLTPPFYKMIEQTDTLDLSFSGTGLNILSGLARNGIETGILTNVPNNSVGHAASAFIRRLGVSDRWVNKVGQHIGTYFLELGYGNRPSQVTYLNREASSFCSYTRSKKEIEKVVEQFDVIHVCGIALSTSKISRQLILDTVKIASINNKKIIFDFNFRPSLNETIDLEQLRKDYAYILKCSDIVFGSPRDIANLYQTDNKDESKLLSNFFEDYSNVKLFCGTIRSLEEKLQGIIYTKDLQYRSNEKNLTTFDRIGTGDAYAFGIVFGLIRNWSLQDTVEFASTAADLSHTTFGDSSILDEIFIKKYMQDPHTQVFR